MLQKSSVAKKSTRKPAPYKSEIIDSDQLGTGGIRLRQHRLARGWTLQVASDRTGVAKSTIQAIEAGKTGFGPDTLQKLAAGFNVTVGELFDVDPRPEAQGAPGGPFWPIWNRADKSQRQRITDIATGIVGPKK